MKVVFNGVLETKTGGCVPCGTKRTSKHDLATSKFYILPSQTKKTFYVGRVEEVSDKDGEFLLSYTYTDKDGNLQHTFSRVD